MTIKRCRTCNLDKPHSDFGKHKDRKLGLADSCKLCRNQKAVLERHNITQAEKQSMLKAQDFKCAICQIHQNKLKINLAVDHCHKTGKIRGLLCSDCNLGLGKFEDNPETIASAIKYLTNKGK